MFLHTPVEEIQNEVLVIEFKRFSEALKISNSLPEHIHILEIIDFTTMGGALLVTGKNLKTFKKKFKQSFLIQNNCLETLKYYYNLQPSNTLKNFVYFEKLKFTQLFELLSICAKNSYQVIDIKNQRAYYKNAILISCNDIDTELSRYIKKFQGTKIDKLSSAVCSFFCTSKPD